MQGEAAGEGEETKRVVQGGVDVQSGVAVAAEQAEAEGVADMRGDVVEGVADMQDDVAASAADMQGDVAEGVQVVQCGEDAD